jgi:hypothetical protein
MSQHKNIWIIHLVGWLIFMSLPLIILSRDSNPDIEFTMLRSGSFWAFVAVYVVLFYLNYLLLIPKLYLKQQYFIYIITFLALISIINYAKPFENLVFQRFHTQQDFPSRNGPDFRPPPQIEFREESAFRPLPPGRSSVPAVDFVSLVLFAMIWVVAMAAKISEQWRLTEKRAILSEAQKAQAELSFFKAQINPHFLFNTLNNIYSVAVNQSENTAPSVMKLSQMMRYITEEATENWVPLEDEIDCLKNYIDLQKLRLNTKTSVLFEVKSAGPKAQIAPLILMTFVENAFKYGTSNHYPSEIKIRIDNVANEILFSCQNKIFDSNKEPDRAGVGIANTKKRLDFLYSENYDLKINNDGEMFSINLKLKSNEMPSH